MAKSSVSGKEKQHDEVDISQLNYLSKSMYSSIIDQDLKKRFDQNTSTIKSIEDHLKM